MMKLNKEQILEYQQNRPPYLMIDFAEEVVPGKSAKGYKDFKEDEKKSYDKSCKFIDQYCKERYYANYNSKGKLYQKIFKLSNKLENTKSQLKYFENNKARLMSQLENLNNIVSESNIIGTPFNTTTSKVNDKLSSNEKISNKKQIPQNQFQKLFSPKKIENAETMNNITKEIFKKK